jgi:hypothetical protein
MRDGGVHRVRGLPAPYEETRGGPPRSQRASRPATAITDESPRAVTALRSAADARTRPAPCHWPRRWRGPLTPPPKPWAASDGPAVRCTVTAWPRECRGHRRPALRTGESGPGLAGGTRGRVRGEPGPRSRGALTLRRFALAVSAIYLGFTGRSASSSRRVNPLPRPRVDCTTPAEQANGPCTRTPSNTPTGAGGRGAGVSCSCGWPCSCCWRWRLRRWSSPPTGAAQLAVNPVGSCRGRYHTD